MFQFRPSVVNTRDSLDSVPLVIIAIPEDHPLLQLMITKAYELYLATLEWEWEEPPGDNYKKMFPGDAWV